MNTQDRRIVGIAFTGGSGSGKSTLARLLVRVLVLLGVYTDRQTMMILLDWFYKCRAHIPDLAERADTSFDEPSALDREEIERVLRGILQDQQPTWTPEYRFHDQTRFVYHLLDALQHGLVVFDGIIVHHWGPPVVQHLDFSIFVDVKEGVRRVRRERRDQVIREIEAEVTTSMWPTVQAGYEQYTLPHRDQADLVVTNNNGDLPATLRTVVDFYLQQTGLRDFLAGIHGEGRVTEKIDAAVAQALQEQKKLIF